MLECIIQFQGTTAHYLFKHTDRAGDPIAKSVYVLNALRACLKLFNLVRNFF